MKITQQNIENALKDTSDLRQLNHDEAEFIQAVRAIEYRLFALSDNHKNGIFTKRNKIKEITKLMRLASHKKTFETGDIKYINILCVGS